MRQKGLKQRLVLMLFVLVSFWHGLPVRISSEVKSRVVGMRLERSSAA